MSQESSRVLKLVIIGDGGIGKTTLTKVFCTGQFVDQIMTIGIDIHTKESLVKGSKTTLQIWDISGQTQFKFLIPDFIRNANGIILAFDCTKETSFTNLEDWFQVIRSKEPDVPIFLIATKVDEDYDPALNIEKIRAFVKEKGLIGFEETSAKLNLNVGIPFKRLLEHIYDADPDTIPISFLGPEERSEYIEPKLTTRSISSFAPPITLETPQEPEILIDLASHFEKTDDEPEPMDTSSIENGSRINQFPTQCPYCNTPLKESQIKLKADGKEVLCRNCLNMI